MAAELNEQPISRAWPGLVMFEFARLSEMHAALDRVYKLAVSLPDAPLLRFRAKTKDLPKTTEAERLMIRRPRHIPRALLQYWGSRCPLTGITEPALLRASHIVAWADCDHEQRLNVHNGLLLSALYDSAFDKGLIRFDDDGSVLASPTLSEAARGSLAIDTAPHLEGLRDDHRANLAKHRSRHGF